jgi:hypothetical protein
MNRRSFVVAGLFLLAAGGAGRTAELYAGAATVSITPDQPVGLDGQMRTRVSTKVESPCTATALALESRAGDKVLDQAILVSCDLVAIRAEVAEAVRAKLKARLPDFPVQKLVLSATHTHTGPVTQEGKYEGLDRGGVMRPSAYVVFLADRVVDAAARAWAGRKPAGVGWGLGHAVVAQNRRAVYAGGTAKMYGKTDDPTFRGLEGHEDDGVEVLFVWGADQKLVATAVNVSCPAQEVEGLSVVNADFWHEVRESLRKKHGADLHVLAWTGAAGDQSPHLMYRKAAEERMRKLRGVTRLEEIARRVVAAWEEAYEGARQDVRTDVPFRHTVRTIELPKRKVTEAEMLEAKKTAAALAADPKQLTLMNWHKRAVDRYEQEQRGPLPPYQMDLHVLRVGDVAIATNDFELFTDYGVQIKSRSPAVQTFVIQLAGPGSYLPTERAVRGGSYSAVVQSGIVGPAGGQELVEQTVSAIKTLWPAAK